MPRAADQDVGAGAADQDVVAVAALQPVLAGAAGDGVVEAVADAGEVADAVVAEDLDVRPGRGRRVRGPDRVDAEARQLVDDVAGVVDEVGVVRRSARP